MEQMKVKNGEVLQTYRGVFLDINKSNICSLKYGVYFYFCSELMKQKFENNVEEYIKNKIDKIQKIVPHCEIVDLNLVLAIEYYRYVEKRGIRIETLRGVKIKQTYLCSDIEFLENTEE